MKKTKLFAMVSIILAMGLVACNGTSSKPSSEPAPASDSSEPAASDSSEPAGSDSTPAASDSSNPGTSTSTPAEDGQMTANGIDIVVENNKTYAKITGTISGYSSADAMKMAFGLQTVVESGTGTYIFGSATPADADYKYAPTVNSTAGTFELKVDLSEVQWVGGTFTAMVGPKGAYSAVASQGGTYGTGKSVMNGFRISIRSHNGTIAADELPPVELTISRIETTTDKVYHVIGGALNTTKLTREAFLAKHPYVQYEATTIGWGKNVMGSSTKTDLVTVSVDDQGNALIKTDITSLTANGYNIKINLNGDSDVDTKMDAIIDETEHPVAFGIYDYIPYAVSTYDDKAHLYGNCGLFINEANRYVAYGEKFADLQPVRSKEGEIAYEMVAADCEGQNNPTYGTQDAQKNTRLGKNSKMTDVWDITGIRTGEYEVYVKGAYSSGNDGAYWSGALQVANTNDTETDGKNGNPYNPAARYNFKINNGTAVDCICEQTYANSGLVGSQDGGWTKVAMAEIMIGDDATSFTMTNSNNGYAIWVYAIRLVRIGNWSRPATDAAFTDGVMRVEAESYHEASAEIAEKTDEEGTYLDHFGNWPQVSVSYKIKFAEAVHVKLKLRYNWHSQRFGNHGAAEFTMDGGSKIHDASGKENLGQTDDGPSDTWTFTESVAFDIAAGEHTFKLQTPGGCTVSYNYFELIIVPAN